jgi:hypothetical protein
MNQRLDMKSVSDLQSTDLSDDIQAVRLVRVVLRYLIP